jgi:hypothetical protein
MSAATSPRPIGHRRLGPQIVNSTTGTASPSCQAADAEFVCAGDTALGPDGNALAYGQSISAGVLQCDSAESGITCRDINTGRGFAIAREAYRVF